MHAANGQNVNGGQTMKIPMLILAAWLMIGLASAQQGYDFLKRDNPFGAAEQSHGLDFLKRDNAFGAAEQPQDQLPGSDFALCWTTAPVPNTKNMIISNVFETRQTVSVLVAQLEQSERRQGINVSFECVIDGSRQAQRTRFMQKISSLSQQGFNISQIQVRPH
jgi:hypothetical protein